MIMVSIALVMAVIVTNIYLRKDTKRPIPDYFRRALFFFRTEAEFRSLGGANRRASSRAVDGLKFEDIGMVLTRPESEGNGRRTSRINGLRTSETGTSGCRDQRSGRLRLPGCDGRGDGGVEDVDAAVEKERYEAMGEEWKRLAKVVDRVFFWVFLVSSVGSLSGMVMRIPP